MSSSAKKKRIQIMEKQDAEGISRKKHKHTINPNLFLTIKLVLAILIPVFYYVYSPLLILIMIGFISTFFLAKMAENSLNKSVIKSNHIHIVKFDAALALIVVMISLVGSFMSLNNKSKTSDFANMSKFNDVEISGKMDNSMFKNMQNKMKWKDVSQYFVNLGSLLTGERNVFDSKNSFGTMEKPDNFATDKSQFDNSDFDFSKMDPPEGGEMPKDFDFGDKDFKGMMKSDVNFSVRDLPISYVSSSALSTINSIFIFSVSAVGILSVVLIFIKKKKFEKVMNEIIFEDTIGMLDEKEVDRILSFGDYQPDKEPTDKQIDKKIKKYEKLDEKELKEEKQRIEKEIEFEKMQEKEQITDSINLISNSPSQTNDENETAEKYDKFLDNPFE